MKRSEDKRNKSSAFQIISRLASDAIRDDTKKTALDGNRSAIPIKENNKVPAINPNCTIEVRSA